MGSWIGIGLLLLVGSSALVWWERWRSRRNLLSLPLFPMTYAEIDAAQVPASIHEALGTVYAELALLGFEPAGYIAAPLFPGAPPRVLGVMRHPRERALACVGFALGGLRGAAVDFETLFEDGSWLRSVNRRGHFTHPNLRSGRELDAMAATLAEQWAAHQRAVAEPPARTSRDASVADAATLRNAVEHEEHALGLADGTRSRAADGVSLRFTPAGVDALTTRVRAATARIAKLPPVHGALAMLPPLDEQERQYQDILYIEEHRPKPRRGRAFLLSAILFATSALLLPHWRWLLWAVPFLLLHELGHFAAMRLFGHRDAHIRFIPFFGAATMTTTQFRKLSHEMVVLFAGPLPGILLGLALFQLAEPGRSPYLTSSAIALVTINGLNLLPLHPLDGGRILHALLTAGRPRLDFALKALAGAVFVALALKFHDVTLVLVGAGAVLFFRTRQGLSRVEKLVREQPNFSPALPPAARRRFIFALMDVQSGDRYGWVRMVRELEARLAHAPPRLAAALPWTALYAGCLGALVAWSVSVFSVTPKVGAACPRRAHAQPVACGAAPADIDWRHPDPGSLTRNPFKLLSRSEYPYAAFVWCAGEARVAGDVMEPIREIAAADGYCPALPWEPGGGEAREKARWTLHVLGVDGRMSRERLLRRLDALPKELRANQEFDAETERLYRASIVGGPDSAAHRELAERLGRSPTDSCKAIRILRTTGERETVATATRGADPDDADERDDDADDEDESAPARYSTRIAVLLASPADFDPLRRYLCDAGCEVDALPYGSMDPRLRWCH